MLPYNALWCCCKFAEFSQPDLDILPRIPGRCISEPLRLFFCSAVATISTRTLKILCQNDNLTSVIVLIPQAAVKPGCVQPKISIPFYVLILQIGTTSKESPEYRDLAATCGVLCFRAECGQIFNSHPTELDVYRTHHPGQNPAPQTNA
jgi:hypothetical protein